MKILIVDDHTMFHQSVVGLLSDHGHSVRSLTPMAGISGTSAEDEFKPIGYFLEWADVIVLGHHLPGDGHTPLDGEMWLTGFQHYQIRQKTVGSSSQLQKYLTRHLFTDHHLAYQSEEICRAIETSLN
jgi:CheY-like chemotaxis protein